MLSLGRDLHSSYGRGDDGGGMLFIIHLLPPPSSPSSSSSELTPLLHHKSCNLYYIIPHLFPISHLPFAAPLPLIAHVCDTHNSAVVAIHNPYGVHPYVCTMYICTSRRISLYRVIATKCILHIYAIYPTVHLNNCPLK